MIWRCDGCGHTLSRHDEPRAGQRLFWCKPCHATSTFTMHPRDQRKPKPSRRKITWKAPAVGSFRKGEFLEDWEGYHDHE